MITFIEIASDGSYGVEDSLKKDKRKTSSLQILRLQDNRFSKGLRGVLTKTVLMPRLIIPNQSL